MLIKFSKFRITLYKSKIKLNKCTFFFKIKRKLCIKTISKKNLTTTFTIHYLLFYNLDFKKKVVIINITRNERTEITTYKTFFKVFKKASSSLQATRTLRNL